MKQTAAKLVWETKRGFARLRVVLLFVLCGLGPFVAPAVWAQNSAPGTRASVPLAVSDFDGDHRPDVARVETGRSDLAQTDYWVELQLTMAGTQAIRVVGPTGGLQVAVRDVNGDQIPDLVLTTAWRDQPVAILLNDGHGSFSRVAPEAFPHAFRASPDSWGGAEMPQSTAAATLSDSRFGGGGVGNSTGLSRRSVAASAAFESGRSKRCRSPATIWPCSSFCSSLLVSPEKNKSLIGDSGR